MATVTSTVTVNAAFLQEIKEDNQHLQALLRSLRDAFGPHGEFPDRFEVLSWLDELRDQLATHFALEEAYGYFEDPIQVSPRFATQAAALRDEHSSLFVQIRDLVDRADEKLRAEDWLPGWNAVRNAFRRFDASFRRHEQQENELILQALDVDIGVGD